MRTSYRSAHDPWCPSSQHSVMRLIIVCRRSGVGRRAAGSSAGQTPALLVENNAQPQQRFASGAGVGEAAADRPVRVLRQDPRFQNVLDELGDRSFLPRRRFVARPEKRKAIAPLGPRRREDNVGRAGQSPHVFAKPVTKSMKSGANSPLRVGVTAPDASHYCAAAFGRDSVQCRLP
jgi:hypothetical protein